MTQGGSPPRLRRLSGRVLFFALAGASVFLALALTYSVLTSAARANAALVLAIETRLLSRLEEGGVSGLAVALNRLNSGVVPDRDRVEVALWRARGDTVTLMRQTSNGVGDALIDVPVGQSGEVRIDETLFRAYAPDIGFESKDWPLQMNDVQLRFAIAVPTSETRAATRTLRSLGVFYLFALVAVLALQFEHWRRYRRGISQINAVLNRYASGETGLRIEGETPAPELVELGENLNRVLPRLDILFADLRALSAHMAHELKTPLQSIRSDLARLARAGEASERTEIIAGVDVKIDAANARLQNVMQLFRLQSDAHVPMEPGIRIGSLAVDLVYDLEELLEARGRHIRLDVDEELTLRGNPRLLELMVMNLLVNAAKYAPEGAEISLSVQRSGPDFIMEIANTGSGFPKRLRKVAFERYARASEHEGESGVGLGLSLVRAIAERHALDIDLPERLDDAGQGMAVVRISGKVETDD